MSPEERVVPGLLDEGGERERPQGRRVRITLGAWLRLFSAGGGLFLFVFALQIIKTGARAVVPLLENLDIAGPTNSLGFGWLAAYLALSGSPVAAIGTTLLAGGVFNEREAFAVIGGSRLGASFIVLAVGYVMYLSRRRSPDGLAIGVVALLTTFTTQGPAVALGLLSLHYGWLDRIQFTPPAGMLDWIDAVYGGPVDFLDDALPSALVFATGAAVLLGSFALFDRALPQLDAGSPGFERALRRLDSKWLMFGMGCAVTAMTLSVSISLTLLVPLSLKGYLRREQIIPYVMGANITTFIDTLAGALVLGGAAAFTVVLTEMVAVGLVSGAVLLLAYGPYSRAVLWAAGRATHSQRNLGVFLAVIVAVPLGLLVV
ncbi:hypothetical protein [Candidatus Amarobacter glycogenicus]|uniref:hypothetical protein n=1 Tax=Candidatus Amarobacter glycogenicus TaxID=3140699 RepID=UPI003134D859|nr:hypothetical protein [Dehalococcoidia bacterium]